LGEYTQSISILLTGGLLDPHTSDLSAQPFPFGTITGCNRPPKPQYAPI